MMAGHGEKDTRPSCTSSLSSPHRVLLKTAVEGASRISIFILLSYESSFSWRAPLQAPMLRDGTLSPSVN